MKKLRLREVDSFAKCDYIEDPCLSRSGLVSKEEGKQKEWGRESGEEDRGDGGWRHKHGRETVPWDLGDLLCREEAQGREVNRKGLGNYLRSLGNRSISFTLSPTSEGMNFHFTQSPENPEHISVWPLEARKLSFNEKSSKLGLRSLDQSPDLTTQGVSWGKSINLLLWTLMFKWGCTSYTKYHTVMLRVKHCTIIWAAHGT